MPQKSKIFFFLAILFLFGFIAMTFSSRHDIAGWLLVGFFLAIALGILHLEVNRAGHKIIHLGDARTRTRPVGLTRECLHTTTSLP